MKRAGLLYIFLLFFCAAARASGLDSAAVAEAEKINVTFKVHGLETHEVGAIARRSKVYVPVVEILTILRINVHYDTLRHRLNGYLYSRDSTWSFDLATRQFRSKRYSGSLDDSDFIVSPFDVYFQPKTFKTYFDLDLVYHPRSISMNLQSPRRDLPIYRINQFQRIIDRQKAVAASQVAERTYEPLTTIFNPGVLEYQLRYDRFEEGNSTAYLSYKSGFELLGGDVYVTGRTQSQRELQPVDYSGNITYPIENNPYISKIVGGDVEPSLGLIGTSVFGVSVTNRRLAFPILFSNDDQISENFGQNRTIFSVIRDRASYMGMTSPTGDFQHTLPVYYGLNTFNLRTFDFWADEIDKSYLFNVPYTLVPAGDWQYNVTMGRSRILPSQGFYGNGSLQWGVTSQLTVGSYVESYQALSTSPRYLFPTMFAYSRLASALILSAVVSPLLQSTVTLDYTTTSLANFNASVIDYSTSVESPVNYRRATKEYDLSATLPLTSRTGGGVFFSTNYQQVNLSNSIDRTAQGTVVFAFVKYFEPSIGYSGSWNRQDGSSVTNVSTTEFALRAQLPASIIADGSIYYDHLRTQIYEYDYFLGKTFGNGFLSFNYRGLFNGYSYAQLSFRYNFPFLSASTSYSRSGDESVYEGSVRGSILFSLLAKDMKGIKFDRTPNLARAGNADIILFEDKNGNGKPDTGETTFGFSGITVSSVTGGTVSSQRLGNRYAIYHMTPYVDYFLSMKDLYLDDPLLVPLYTSFLLKSRAGEYSPIYIPLVYGGTISGTVNEMVDSARVPVEGMTILLIPADSTRSYLRREVKTFSTGEYELTRVAPGRYRIELSADELRKTGFSAKVTSIPVSVVVKPGGDMLENINFLVRHQ